MRHNNKINHLGRTHAHREAMLSNMAVSLIKHKRIFTTLAKAKELRKYVEPLITKCKDDSTHSRRIVFKNLRDKYAVTELFNDVSQKIGDRPGGYTRIIKIGNRLGDNASTCFIELVDYNELMLKDKTTPAKSKTRRSRRSTGKGVADTTPETEVKAATKKAPKAKPVEKIVETVEEIVETVEEVKEEPVAEIPVTETETAAPAAAENATEEEAPKNE
jgi:large subunit ribosomal protein L17